MAVSRPWRQYEQKPRVPRRAHLMAFVRIKYGGEPGAATHGVSSVAHLHLAVDHDEVGAFVHLVLLERISLGQLDRDRASLATGGVQDLRAPRFDRE